MFISRDIELKKISGFMASDMHAMLVYGRRRVGKTALIDKASYGFQGKVVSYLCTKEDYSANLRDLVSEYCLVFNDSNRSFGSFPDFFRFLRGLGEDILVILDEYCNLKEAYGSDATDSMMQKIIDGLKGSRVKIALCGSEISVMKELMDRDNPLFDRFDLSVHVEPFDYYDSALFFPSSDIRWKVESYAIFGGLPAALERVDPEHTMEENIISLFLEPEGRVRTLIERTIMQEYRKIGPVYSLLSELGNGKRTYSELRERLDPRNTGNLSKLLDKLINNESVKCIYPINRKAARKTTFYVISDNLLRFYFTYVHPNRSRIERFGANAVYRQSVAPSIGTYVSYRFEEIARSFFCRAVKAGVMDDVQDVGIYWYDDKATRRNGEFDCALSFNDGYDIFEVKCPLHPMDLSMAEEEAAKILSITGLDVRKIGFVSLEGFSFSSDEYILVDGRMLFSPSLVIPVPGS